MLPPSNAELFDYQKYKIERSFNNHHMGLSVALFELVARISDDSYRWFPLNI